MSDWKEVTLGEICSIEIGGTPSRSEERYWWKSGSDGVRLPWVSISDMKEKVITDTKESITEIGALKSNCKHVPRGTLLMSFKLTIGRLAFAGRDLYTNEAISAIRPTKDVNAEFLYYGLQHWNLTGDSDQAVKGVTLNKQKLQEIPCLLPPLPEQKKIAEILSGIDKILERTKRRTATLELLEIATRNGLFENLTKESHLEVRLSEIVLAPITYGIVQPGDYDPNGIILVRGQDYLQGWGKKEFFKVSPELSGKYKRSLIKPKDVLICIAGANTGDSSITPKWISNANITQTTARVRADTNIISPEFLLEFTKSRVGRERLMNYVKGSAQPGLNLSDIEKVVIPIPGNDEQQRISNSMDSLKKLVLSSRKKEDYRKQIKKGLVSDLLSGRKRVSI